MRTRVQHLRLAWATLLALVLGFAGDFSSAKGPPGKGSPEPSTTSTTAPVGTTYTGRAFGAFVNVPPLVDPQFISDTGELHSDGTPRSASFLNLALPPDASILRATLLEAHTSGANSVAESFAFVVGADVLNGLLKASVVRAESEATCNGVRGSTEIADLTFGGRPIIVDGSIKQVVEPIVVPGVGTATLIINEQIQNSGPGFREITVNAIHLTVEGVVQADVILSSARSDIHGCPGCPPKPDCSHDFVTGGGWINVGNSRGNFGFNAGFKGGSATPDVHFNYIDHNTGMHMKATSITEYVATGPTSRRFEGAADIDGTAGTYVIEVADNGEPGRSTDTFTITLSDGVSTRYSAGGTLAGGNIQLHKPCP